MSSWEIQTILVYVDLSPERLVHSEVSQAAALASRTGARLTFAITGGDVPPGGSEGPGEPTLLRPRGGHERLDEVLRALGETGATIEVLSLGEDPLRHLVEVARRGYDLVVKAIRREDERRRLLRERPLLVLLRETDCPVLAVREEHQTPFRRVLVGVPPGHEPSELDLRVARAAGALADAEGAELHAATALPRIDEMMLTTVSRSTSVPELVQDKHDEDDAALRELNETMAAALPWVGTAHVVRGEPEEALSALASRLEADLLVIGTVARKGLPGLIVGNTAEKLIRASACSLLVIPPRRPRGRGPR